MGSTEGGGADKFRRQEEVWYQSRLEQRPELSGKAAAKMGGIKDNLGYIKDKMDLVGGGVEMRGARDRQCGARSPRGHGFVDA